MALKKGNTKPGAGAGSAKMGGPGAKPGKPFGGGKSPAPSDNDGDEAPAFKRGGSVKAKAKDTKAKTAKKGKC